MSTAEKSSPVTDRRRRGSTREKMVRTAAVLLREHGVAGTTIDRVLAVSGAPRGSVYHHFPGGRAQLLSEAVEFATDSIIELAGAAGRAIRLSRWTRSSRSGASSWSPATTARDVRCSPWWWTPIRHCPS
ncbi:TetR/AcrR family transcriptional regulator [Dietzia aerolata]|uniref:TetR/AcrR family transcriptional regulator n=1 Tax=Dietzia aerolata TaxID=595984 RepID=UPI00363C6C16